MRAMLGAVLTMSVLGGCATPALLGPGPAAAPPPAPVAPQPPEVRLVAAIEDRGCVLTNQNVSEVLLAANMTQAELADVTPRLAAAGRVEVSGEGQIRVLTDRCI